MKKTVSIFLTFMLTLSLVALPVQTALGAQWLAGHGLGKLSPTAAAAEYADYRDDYGVSRRDYKCPRRGH
jgi:hypothetical protein